MIYVLYNPLADNRNGRSNAAKIREILKNREISYLDVTQMRVTEFLQNIAQKDRIILSGGDGTLHHFVNECGGKVPEHPVYYYPTGSGNDFMADVQERENSGIILLNPYLCHLPTVTVNGDTRFFLNGVGYGIDGYCCEEGDRQRAEESGSINYTAIAIKGLMFRFKPRNATVIVDGVVHNYKNVWLAPTMNGRFYGGGMMIAPNQDRLRKDGLVSTVVMHCKSKVKTLAVFPSIFKGEHIRHKEMVEVTVGKEIEVIFDQPTSLQIDGETVLNVSSYCVHSYAACTGVSKNEKQTFAKV